MNKENTAAPTASESPEGFGGLHKALLGVAAFFFFYLVVNGLVLVPMFITRYGLH